MGQPDIETKQAGMSFFDNPSGAYNAFRRTALSVTMEISQHWNARREVTEEQYRAWAEELVHAGETLFELTTRETALSDPALNLRRTIKKISDETIKEIEEAWFWAWKCLPHEQDEEGCYIDPLPNIPGRFDIAGYTQSRFGELGDSLEFEILETLSGETRQADPNPPIKSDGSVASASPASRTTNLIGDSAGGLPTACRTAGVGRQSRSEVRAAARSRVVDPILNQKSWTLNKWGTQAGVGKNCPYEYMHGKRCLSEPNRTAMAEVLGLTKDQLPND